MRNQSRFGTALILALLLVGAPVPSDSASLPEITTIGAGGDACRRWTETAEQPSSRYQYRQWLFGFVSGYNWRNPAVQVMPPNGDSLVRWIEEFCKVNPEVPIYVGAARMARQMEKPRNAPTGKKP